MSRGRKKSLGKRMNPTYFVFCEGETERAYINMLRSHYRIPIEIKPKISGNRISQRHIDRFLHDRPRSKRDKIFLIYDLDVKEVVIKLKQIKSAILLITNPCLELWFVLHFQDYKTYCTSKNSLLILRNYWRNYKKGKLLLSQQRDLLSKQDIAIERAKKGKRLDNPSSSVYRIIEELDKIRKEKLLN